MPFTTSRSDGPALATFEVHCDGRALPDSVQVVSLHVHRAFGLAASARLVMRPGGGAQGEWAVADDLRFKPGARLRVAAGYDGQNALLFEGAVMQLGLRLTGTDGGELVVQCQGDAAQTPLGPQNLQAAPGSGPAALKVEWGVNLFELDAGLSWPAAPGGGAVSGGAARARLRGRLAFQGSSAALPGQRVTLAGVGQRFSGDVFLIAVDQVLSEGQWRAQAEFGSAEEAFGGHAGAASLAG